MTKLSSAPTQVLVTSFVRIPLAQIDIDHTWNTRALSHLAAEPDPLSQETSATIADLEASILEYGQETPAKVRPHPDPKRAAKTPYKLVAGFRRAEALARIAKNAGKNLHPIHADPDWSSQAPTIIAQVETLSETGAILKNVSENSGRKSIAPSDLVFAMRRLMHERRDWPNQGPESLPRVFGAAAQLSQPYAYRLYYIGKDVPEKALLHWRASPRPLSIYALYDVAKHEPAHERQKVYDGLCQSGFTRADALRAPDGRLRRDKPTAEGGQGETVFERMTRQLDKAGEQLGRLQEAGLVEVNRAAFEEKPVLRVLATIDEAGADSDPDGWSALTEAAIQGFDRGVEEYAVKKPVESPVKKYTPRRIQKLRKAR